MTSTATDNPLARPGEDAEVIVRFDGATKTFVTGKGKGRREVTAVDDVTLNIRRGEIYGVIGYSGAGKSTLVRMINGLEPATSGEIEVDGRRVDGRTEEQLAPIRRDIGMIFQQFNLFTSRTVAGNVEYPLIRAGWSKDKRKARVAELLQFVGLSERAGNYPEQLSGGQKQRVGIARALAAQPKILLADESTSALDPETTQEVLNLLRRANREFGITVVLITHEMDVVRSIADRVAVMDSGRVVEEGATAQVFSAPTTSTARKFVATVSHDEPDAEELAYLSEKRQGRLVVIDIRQGVDVGPVLSAAAARGVSFRIVFGGVSVLQKQSFGSLTVDLSGEPHVVDDAIEALSQVTTVKEVSA
ncbi:methionine ABC transporter ATP-binding protein [Kocuria coralli]|uniref:Methionine ABC transporter ATP-binding protein n=1 Tax=Kocuria coralli TaxID=1461025 RepID=A0A5J5KV38_9MICC|nr:methionine ABC transporter ATP-binding protein [Kocuria coralli]KAA9393577.1 methionine ABC transporter ATP-binding protein [Kocuria coralli]